MLIDTYGYAIMTIVNTCYIVNKTTLNYANWDFWRGDNDRKTNIKLILLDTNSCGCPERVGPQVNCCLLLGQPEHVKWAQNESPKGKYAAH